MSDRLRFLAALHIAGSRGLHSHEVRQRGISGHPSERAAELGREGYTIRREREYVDGRNGVRFYLEGEPEPVVGIGTGVPTPQGPGGVRPSPLVSTSVDPSDRPDEPIQLFQPEPERPLSAFTDAEAA